MTQQSDPVKPGEPDARRRRWHGHRQARRGELTEAAVQAIRRHGPDVGMDEIAAEAGITKPVLYRHFADKADLYQAVGQYMAEDLLTRIGPSLAEADENRERIAAVIDAYLGAIEAEPEVYRFVTRRTFAGGALRRDPVADYAALIGNALAGVIADRIHALGDESGASEQYAGAADPWGHGLVGLVQAAGDWWLRAEAPMSRQRLTDYLTTLIWSGFAGILDAAAVLTGREGAP